jgi:hypothetical protein
MKTLALADLLPHEGRYAMRVFDGNTFSELGGGTLVLKGDTLTYTPEPALSKATAGSFTITAVCQNTDVSKNVIGVVAVIDSQRHMDFFAPAFSGLYASGSDLGTAPSSGNYLQSRVPKTPLVATEGLR